MLFAAEKLWNRDAVREGFDGRFSFPFSVWNRKAFSTAAVRRYERICRVCREAVRHRYEAETVRVMELLGAYRPEGAGDRAGTRQAAYGRDRSGKTGRAEPYGRGYRPAGGTEAAGTPNWENTLHQSGRGGFCPPCFDADEALFRLYAAADGNEEKKPADA